MIAGLEDSTRHCPAMEEWADQYTPGIATKYSEVAGALFSKGGALCGTQHPNSGGFIADSVKALAVGSELFVAWAKCNTSDEFVDKFLLQGLGGRGAIAGTHILKQFLAEEDDIKLFAEEMYSAFTTHGQPELVAANKNLNLFFDDIQISDEEGNKHSFFTFQNQSEPLKHWIEMLSVTGLLHTGTFSFSRLLLTQPIMALLRPETNHFDDLELSALTLLSGTIVGMVEEKHVFTKQFERDLRYFHDAGTVARVLTNTNERAVKRRTDYLVEIQNHPDFLEIGWILTDYCDDEIDNKQITIATYV